MRTLSRKPTMVSALFSMLVLGLGVGQEAPCCAQTQTQGDAHPTVAAMHEPSAEDTGTPKNTTPATAQPAGKSDAEISLDIAKELAVMKARIEQLEAELKNRAASESATSISVSGAARSETKSTESASTAAVRVAAAAQAGRGLPEKPKPTDPFAYADWTWLNGNPRNKDVVWDSKFFTPEIRMDIHYIEDLNHPKDDTMGGSTETFRSNEIHIEQISFGGNFHWQNVNARILTMNGMFGVTTPRNDASAGRGQWDLRGAYKYVSEANAGYHFDVNHGLNIDAGIFVSYIGLFSYYNFDNWTYQPS